MPKIAAKLARPKLAPPKTLLNPSSREDKSGALAKRGLCPLRKTGGFDENGENDEWRFYPQKQGLCSSDP